MKEDVLENKKKEKGIKKLLNKKEKIEKMLQNPDKAADKYYSLGKFFNNLGFFFAVLGAYSIPLWFDGAFLAASLYAAASVFGTISSVKVSKNFHDKEIQCTEKELKKQLNKVTEEIEMLDNNKTQSISKIPTPQVNSKSLNSQTKLAKKENKKDPKKR